MSSQDRFNFRTWDKHTKRMFNTGFINIESGLHEDWRSQYGEDGTYETSHVIMQSTGLRDKEGKLIYESDLLKWDGESVGHVYYSEYGEWLVGLGNPDHDRPLCACPVEDVEIIGNIYTHDENQPKKED